MLVEFIAEKYLSAVRIHNGINPLTLFTYVRQKIRNLNTDNKVQQRHIKIKKAGFEKPWVKSMHTKYQLLTYLVRILRDIRVNARAGSQQRLLRSSPWYMWLS